MARVLITGGAGFVGSHLAERCLAGGDEVHVLVRPQTSLKRLEGFERIGVHPFGTGDHAAVAKVIAEIRPETIYHLAINTRPGKAPALEEAAASINDYLADLIALYVAANAASDPPKVFVRAGSLAEYGAGPAPFIESQREVPLNAYSASLVAGAHYSRMLQPHLSFPIVTARLALVYGPRQSEEFLVPEVICNCLAGRRTLLKRPNDRRDLVHVHDAVDALMRLASERAAGLYNVCSGAAPAVGEIAELVAHLAGSKEHLLDRAKETAPGGMPEQRGSFKALHKLTGWQARIPLEQGLSETVAWYAKALTREPAL